MCISFTGCLLNQMPQPSVSRSREAGQGRRGEGMTGETQRGASRGDVPFLVVRFCTSCCRIHTVDYCVQLRHVGLKV